MTFQRILVTGAAGFIGSHIVEELLKSGYMVRALDNLSTGKRENLVSACGGELNSRANFEFVQGDIRELKVVESAVETMDAILHQAALGSVPRSVLDPATTQDVNAGGTLNIFLAAKKFGIGRVVYASSSSVYGDSSKLPKKEGEEGKPLSPYALTKKNNEEYGNLFKSLYGLQTIGLRYFNVYGPRQDPDSEYAAVIPRFVTALLSNTSPTIYGTGEQSRDFTFVKDVVLANVCALKAPESATGDCYNIARGERTSLLVLLNVLRSLLGSETKPVHEAVRAGDVMHSWAETAKTEAHLGFKAKTELQNGLEQSIDWYRANL